MQFVHSPDDYRWDASPDELNAIKEFAQRQSGVLDGLPLSSSLLEIQSFTDGQHADLCAHMNLVNSFAG